MSKRIISGVMRMEKIIILIRGSLLTSVIRFIDYNLKLEWIFLQEIFLLMIKLYELVILFRLTFKY